MNFSSFNSAFASGSTERLNHPLDKEPDQCGSCGLVRQEPLSREKEIEHIIQFIIDMLYQITTYEKSIRGRDRELAALNNKLGLSNHMIKWLHEDMEKLTKFKESSLNEIDVLKQELELKTTKCENLSERNMELVKLSAKKLDTLKLKECLVCMDADRSVVLLPCKHLALCGECAGKLSPAICPVCRTEIDDFIHVIMN